MQYRARDRRPRDVVFDDVLPPKRVVKQRRGRAPETVRVENRTLRTRRPARHENVVAPIIRFLDRARIYRTENTGRVRVLFYGADEKTTKTPFRYGQRKSLRSNFSF